MTRSVPATLARILTVGLVGTLTLLVSSPFVRAIRVQRELRVAQALLASDRPQAALAALRPMEAWAAPHPLLDRALACVAISCHVREGEPETALALSERLLEDHTPTPAPDLASRWHATLAPAVDWALRRSAGAHAPTPWSGCQTLAAELRMAGDEAHLLQLRATIAPRTPPPELADLLQPHRHPATGAAPATLSRTPPPSPSRPKSPPEALTESPAEPAPPRWAIIKSSRASAYDSEGKRIGFLDPGTFLAVDALRRSPSGQFAVCRSVDGLGQKHVIVRTRDLHIRPGAFQGLSAEAKDLARHEVEIEQEIARLRARHVTTDNGANPHAAEYAAARKAYKAYWAEVNELIRKRDESTGEAHMQYSDKLRNMKGEDVRVGRALEAAQARYQEGRKGQGDDAQIMTPEIVAKEGELRRVRESLGSPLPSP